MWDDDGENVLEHLAGVEDFVHDFKGKQLRDLKQAREHALIIARDVDHEVDAFARANF